jgi:hypothetical protein
MESTHPKNKKTFRKLLELHNELVLWLEKQKLLLIKARSIEELGTIYCEISNGFRKKEIQLDNLLRQSIEESRNNFKNISHGQQNSI